MKKELVSHSDLAKENKMLSGLLRLLMRDLEMARDLMGSLPPGGVWHRWCDGTISFLHDAVGCKECDAGYCGAGDDDDD